MSNPRPDAAAVTATVTAIWRNALGVGDDELHLTFLDADGQSITAVRILTGLRAELGIDLPLEALFDDPTLAELVTLVLAA